MSTHLQKAPKNEITRSSDVGAAAGQASPARGNPLSVLLVEDAEMDAALLVRELEKKGYDLTWARVDTREGMERALAQRSWDVVVADYTLPSFSGLAALELLHEKNIDLPFILVSGTIGEEVAVAAMKAGAHDFIPKDRLTRLVPAIQRELRDVAIRRAHALERKRAEERASVLLEIARDLGGTLELAPMLERVQRRAAAALPCDALVTFYRDNADGVVRPIAHLGLPDEMRSLVETLAFEPESLAQDMVSQRHTLVVNDPRQHPWLPGELLARLGIKSFIAAPLRVRSRRLGALTALNFGDGRAFDEGQVELFEGVARQLAVAMESVDLYREQQEEAEVAAALARVGRELIATVSSAETMERLCQTTAELFGCDFSHTMLLRKEEDAFVPIASYGRTPEEAEAIRMLRLPREIFVGVLERLGHEETVQLSMDESSNPAVPDLADQFGIGRVLYMALRRGEELIGFQAACRSRPEEAFTACQERIARGIARLASLALENARLVDELKRANRLKSDFVATMSHELRTPLNIILGYNDLMIEGIFGELNEDQLDAAHRICKSSKDLLDLINATLDLSRLDAGRLPLEVKDVEIHDLMREIDSEIREVRLKPGVEFAWTFSPRPVILRTDPLKLKVVLKNLILNAVKFTEAGNVTVAAHPLDSGFEIAVSDTGIGIGPETLPIIFEPFRQGDSSLTRRYGGLGLGLHIVRRLLELLGGTIDVESEVGRGSIFRVRLPVRVQESYPLTVPALSGYDRRTGSIRLH
jgi:signal transduction histidine kinase/CheY-like chemotaxis protein